MLVSGKMDSNFLLVAITKLLFCVGPNIPRLWVPLKEKDRWRGIVSGPPH